ncbi:hypothetical protein N7493_004727 [Penicillium malachiteum]|uniref:Uncharacterized protein n=1 Tax=Penicillium malachiteum TaxID=1324776 RepID=A0AAD6MXJ1_9EURO|nr:hypothetical protein N7493_004727 [Penicillium malachiteum]
MPDTLYTKLRKLDDKAALVFAAALDCNEGKITPQQLQRTAETSAWESEHLLDGLYFHARNLKVPGAGVIFTKNSNPGDRFLAEVKKSWMEPGTRIILPPSFLRYLNKLPLHRSDSMITRRTRLDLLLDHVFLRANPSSSKALTLKTDLEWAYSGLPYPDQDYTCTCYGVPYYSIWYGPLEDLATNFVIVHTETPGYFDEGEVHVYMVESHFVKASVRIL